MNSSLKYKVIQFEYARSGSSDTKPLIEARFWILDFCHPLTNPFSFPLSDKNKISSIESDFEYLMPPATSRIPAVSLSDWPILRASSGARRCHCREAAAQLSAPASTRPLLPNLHLTSHLCYFHGPTTTENPPSCDPRS
jgi:hypothetical protein